MDTSEYNVGNFGHCNLSVENQNIGVFCYFVAVVLLLLFFQLYRKGHYNNKNICFSVGRDTHCVIQLFGHCKANKDRNQLGHVKTATKKSNKMTFKLAFSGGLCSIGAPRTSSQLP